MKPTRPSFRCPARLRRAALPLALALSAAAAAAEERAADTDASPRLEQLRQQITAQARSLAGLRRLLDEQEAALGHLREQLEARPAPSPAPTAGVQADSGPAAVPPQARAPASPPEPQAAASPPRVATLFEQPGVLSPKGQFTLEPSLQSSYASSNRVALVGYTVIPAVLVGVIDIREVKASTLAAALSARYGLSSRFEIELKLPYVHRSDTTVGRQVAQASTESSVFEAGGRGIGDVELSARYQLNNPGADGAFYVGGLRLKTRTGKDPFQIMTSTSVAGAAGEGMQTELPTGSGFYALQPSLTALLPSDPAVFFGSVSYLQNITRHGVVSNTDQGPVAVGTVAAGGIFGFNFGMGVSLNERSSFSIGYDHSFVDRTRINGAVAADSVRLQLGTLLLGYSYRLDNQRSLNLALGAGLTRDTPDVTLTLRLPSTF